MAIGYDDGTFGPVRPAEEVAQDLADHFAGVGELDGEPVRAFFGETVEDVEGRIEEEVGLTALRERLDELEERVDAAAREAFGIVRSPTAAEVERYSGDKEAG